MGRAVRIAQLREEALRHRGGIGDPEWRRAMTCVWKTRKRRKRDKCFLLLKLQANSEDWSWRKKVRHDVSILNLQDEH
eukprot:1306609-Karenia_brevis.AAC.1